MKLGVITVTRQGAAIGNRILAAEPEAVLYVPTKCGREPGERVRLFSSPLAPLVADLYGAYEGFAFVMALGIVVRVIARHIGDKRHDPAVVVIDVTGRFAVSLLSGHVGGANALARRLATITGGVPVITTGTDVNDTIAPDLIALEIGAEIDDVDAMKHVSAALVDGALVGVVDLLGVDAPSLGGPLKPNVTRFSSLETLRGSAVSAAMVITNRLVDLTQFDGRPVVVLYPKNLVVGVGCNRGTTADEIVEAIERVLGEHRLSRKSLRALATLDAKHDELGLVDAARRFGVPLELCAAVTVNAISDAPSVSPAALKYMGVQGVAEPSALAVSRGRLIVVKVKSGNVTVAVAEAVGSA